MATSMKRRLAELTAGLSVPGDALEEPTVEAPASSTPQMETRFPRPGAGVTPRTGPGQMLAFRGHMLASEEELNSLRQELKVWEASAPTKKLDSTKVQASRWSNRHPASFETAAFAGLKAEIANAGGNVQPILVRLLPGSVEQYEVVFGHRRHRACLELGLPVLSMIWKGTLPDSELFALMDRENRERADLSPFEQGQMYVRALEEGLYPSVRQLAESLGMSHTWVNKALVVARLPLAIINAFSSPLDIQFKHAQAINLSLEHDQRGVLKRAEKLHGQSLTPSAVVAQLTGSKQSGAASSLVSLHAEGQVVGSCHLGKDGVATIKILPKAFAGNSIDQLIAACEVGLRSVRAEKI